jgi:hypothetical protein
MYDEIWWGTIVKNCAVIYMYKQYFICCPILHLLLQQSATFDFFQIL